MHIEVNDISSVMSSAVRKSGQNCHNKHMEGINMSDISIPWMKSIFPAFFQDCYLKSKAHSLAVVTDSLPSYRRLHYKSVVRTRTPACSCLL